MCLLWLTTAVSATQAVEVEWQFSPLQMKQVLAHLGGLALSFFNVAGLWLECLKARFTICAL